MSAPVVRYGGLSVPAPTRRRRSHVAGKDSVPLLFGDSAPRLAAPITLLPSYQGSCRTFPRQCQGEISSYGTSSANLVPLGVGGKKEPLQTKVRSDFCQPPTISMQGMPLRLQRLPSSRLTNASSINSSFFSGDCSRLPATLAAQSPIPLRNFGNTCYMNATMQCILHSPWLLSGLTQASNGSKRLVVMSALLGFSSPNIVGTGELLLSIKNEAAKCNAEFRGNGQSDAHEFLRTFLFMVHSEINISGGEKIPYERIEDIDNENEEEAMQRWQEHFLRVDNSIIYDLFGGIMLSKCICSSCGKVSLTFDPFLDLSLPMPQNTKKILTIESLLESNFDGVEEKLCGGSQLQCSRCKRLRNGTRSVKITRWPKLLVLHLKRFDERWKKNSAPVVCPESFMTHGSVSVRYRLYGVVCHSGSESWGHYTSYVRMSTGSWFLCNDMQITPTSASNAMRALTQAYIVFYSTVWNRAC